MPESEPSVRVVDNADRSRYEAYVGDDLAGFVIYRSEPGARVLIHTEVDSKFEGRGVGSQLATAALGDARSRGFKIEPLCPFISAYLGRHPEYADLVAGSGRGG
jgi:predicted GNAT family acetyltransferase